MARWESGAEERLRQAALDLYVERGFENVTANDIAERAGLTRRTFFRYFTDTREVLFAGTELLPIAVADAMRDADSTFAPIDVAFAALRHVGGLLTEFGQHAHVRRAVIAASPELRERERTKLAVVSEALVHGLRLRGSDETTAELLAQVGTAVFATAFGRWIDRGGGSDYGEIFDEAVDELRSALAVQSNQSRTAAAVQLCCMLPSGSPVNGS